VTFHIRVYNLKASFMYLTSEFTGKGKKDLAGLPKKRDPTGSRGGRKPRTPTTLPYLVGNPDPVGNHAHRRPRQIPPGIQIQPKTHTHRRGFEKSSLNLDDLARSNQRSGRASSVHPKPRSILVVIVVLVVFDVVEDRFIGG
jgi:hypothetical protein